MCSDYFLYKFLSYVFSYIISFVGHAHTYLFENEISFPPCLANSVVDSDRQISRGGQSSRPWDKGRAVSKDFFWALRASVWSKNKGSVFFSTMDKEISFFKNIRIRADEAWKCEKTTARKSLQFVRKKSGYSGKKRMEYDLLRNFWIALRD